ncbi:hypothetical protein [Streptomyces sp. NPDC052036]|uniref:hypothetical protein n=1 Tax=unclassified Streptomyces TaxID=2593676 RepID=UPI003432474D
MPWQDGEDDNDVSTGDFAKAVNTAVASNASAVSVSYGYTADVTNTSGADLTALKHKGVAITASTGDEGFNGGIHQMWPSNLPSVIAVGGVTLPATGPSTGWWAAGSGCETDFAAATGQPITSGNYEDFHQCAEYPGISPELCNAGAGWDGLTGIGMPHGLGAS